MLTCPYCREQMKSGAGMSMHIRRGHPARWKNTLKASIPSGFNLGVPEKPKLRAVVGKGMKKPPIRSECPECDYVTWHPPALANHIKGNHPDFWELWMKDKAKRKLPPLLVLDEIPRKAGRQPMDLSLLDPVRAKTLRLKRAANARARQRNIAKGLTASGQPRKRGPYAPKQPDLKPAIVEAKIVKKEVLLTQGRMFINRCPDCGKRLDPHYVAAGIAAEMDYEEAKTKVNLYEANQNQ